MILVCIKSSSLESDLNGNTHGDVMSDVPHRRSWQLEAWKGYMLAGQVVTCLCVLLVCFPCSRLTYVCAPADLLQASERASDAINSCFHAYLSHAMIIFINNASPFQLKIILGFLFHFLDIAVHFDFFFHAMPLSISVHMHTHSLPPWLESYNYNL